MINLLPNVRISFDPGELYVRRGMTNLLPIIKRCSIIFLNRNEMKILTKEKYIKGSKVLLNRGARIVVCKLGSQGCYITDGKDDFTIEPFKVKVVDTTGAGDAFTAGMLYALTRGKSPKAAGRIAAACSAICIQEVGARSGPKSKKELMKFLKKN